MDVGASALKAAIFADLRGRCQSALKIVVYAPQYYSDRRRRCFSSRILAQYHDDCGVYAASCPAWHCALGPTQSSAADRVHPAPASAETTRKSSLAEQAPLVRKPIPQANS